MPQPALHPARKLFPRSSLLARLEGLLDRTAQRLDALDPPPAAASPAEELRPVMRLLRGPERLPRADR